MLGSIFSNAFPPIATSMLSWKKGATNDLVVKRQRRRAWAHYQFFGEDCASTNTDLLVRLEVQRERRAILFNIHLQ